MKLVLSNNCTSEISGDPSTVHWKDVAVIKKNKTKQNKKNSNALACTAVTMLVTVDLRVKLVSNCN